MSYIKKIIRNAIPYGLVEKREQRIRFENENKYLHSIPNSHEPEVFNKYGEQMRVFYLDDTLGSYSYSFCTGRDSRYIFWDRANKNLNYHFYSHQQILHSTGTPLKKYALLIESEQIVPQDYMIFDKNPGLSKEFDKIFTFSERILEKYDNALLYIYGTVWYGTEFGGGKMDPDACLKKSKGVSMVSSGKTMCDLHLKRIDLAKKMSKNPYVDTFGTFDGGSRLEILADAFTDYRYNIAFENALTRNYFTEKVMNCFASMTIPIFIGADNIGDFFNADGIIQVTPDEALSNMDCILKLCTKEFYEERISAIIDNYNRVQDYLCPEDYIYKHYNQYFK